MSKLKTSTSLQVANVIAFVAAVVVMC